MQECGFKDIRLPPARALIEAHTSSKVAIEGSYLVRSSFCDATVRCPQWPAP